MPRASLFCATKDVPQFMDDEFGLWGEPVFELSQAREELERLALPPPDGYGQWQVTNQGCRGFRACRCS